MYLEIMISENVRALSLLPCHIPKLMFLREGKGEAPGDVTFELLYLSHI